MHSENKDLCTQKDAVNSDVSNPNNDPRTSFYQDSPDYRPLIKSSSLHKIKQDKNYSKVLVLYTGGTIGMIRSKDGVYAPVPNLMEKKIKLYPQLHDPM
ncbi:hypothetical protein X975_12557, partial [Stegodyphus mimosarum]